MKNKHSGHIYRSWKHVFVVIFFVSLPFLYTLLFAEYANIAAGVLAQDFSLSLLRIMVAYVFSAVIAWICAVLFYRGRAATISLPIFDVLQSFPTFAALPLAVHVWGVSDTTVVVFLVLTVVWPIFFSIISSLKLIRDDWQEAVEVFDLRGYQYFRKFLLPASLPGLITGSIIGLGEGWEALIATEMLVGTPRGLGKFFQTFADNATVTALGIFGFLLAVFVINKFVWLSMLEWSHEKMDQ